MAKLGFKISPLISLLMKMQLYYLNIYAKTRVQKPFQLKMTLLGYNNVKHKNFAMLFHKKSCFQLNVLIVQKGDILHIFLVSLCNSSSHSFTPLIERKKC